MSVKQNVILLEVCILSQSLRKNRLLNCIHFLKRTGDRVKIRSLISQLQFQWLFPLINETTGHEGIWKSCIGFNFGSGCW